MNTSENILKPANENKTTMMYNGANEVPWYAKGTMVQGCASSSEALKASGLDWEVQKHPAYANVGKFQKVSGVNFVIRQDTKEVLGYVGDRYKPLQNKDAFGFFDNIVGDNEAIFEAGGSFRGGTRIWLLAKMPDFIRVKGDDIIEKYVLLTNSHDGKSPVTVKITPIRVMCANTLNLALKGEGAEYKVRHTTNMDEALKEGKNVMGFTNLIYDQVEEIFQAAATKQYNEEMVNNYLNSVFGESNKTPKIKEDVLYLLEEGAGVDDPSLRYTAYHVYNGVTEWVDHHKSFSKKTDQLEAISFGSGAKIKEKAMSEMMATL